MSTKAPRRGKVERKATFIHDVRKPRFSHEKKGMKLDPLPHTKPTQNGFRAKLKNLRRKYWGKFLEAGLGNDTFD